MCFEQKYEKYQNFYPKNFTFFLVVKFSVYLNRHVFLMNTLIQEVGSTKTYERISTGKRFVVDSHCINITAKFAVSIKENQEKSP